MSVCGGPRRAIEVVADTASKRQTGRLLKNADDQRLEVVRRGGEQLVQQGPGQKASKITEELHRRPTGKELKRNRAEQDRPATS